MHPHHSMNLFSQLLPLIAPLVALFVALVGPRIYIYWQRRSTKTKLNIFNYSTAIQNGSYLGRLIVQNAGKTPAKAVEAFVEKILDDGNARINFIPMPLAWTHYESKTRDIQGSQYVYLDIFIFNPDNGALDIASPIKFVSDFINLRANTTELLIALYQNSGQTLKQTIKIGRVESGPPTIEII